MGSSEKRSKDAMSDIPTFSAENMQNNFKVIQNSRTFLSIIAGVLAGIIGFIYKLLIQPVKLILIAVLCSLFCSRLCCSGLGFLDNGVDLLMTWCTYSKGSSAANEDDDETTHKKR